VRAEAARRILMRVDAPPARPIPKEMRAGSNDEIPVPPSLSLGESGSGPVYGSHEHVVGRNGNANLAASTLARACSGPRRAAHLQRRTILSRRWHTCLAPLRRRQRPRGNTNTMVRRAATRGS